MIPLSPPHTRVSLSLILEEYWYSHGNDPIPYLVLAHDVNYSQLLIFFFQNVVPIFKKSNVLEGVRALIDHLKEKQSTVEMNPRSKQLKRKKREKKVGECPFIRESLGVKTPEDGFPLTSRFSGLMSRWTMFRLCRYLMALARLYSIPLASRSVYLLVEVMASKRSPPWKRAAG